MDYKALTCPYCGARLPAEGNGSTITCEYCGHALTPEHGNGPDKDPNKVTLTILYDAGAGNAPELRVAVSGKDDGELRKVLFGGFRNGTGEVKSHRVPNMRKLRLVLDKGDYNALFSINIYKKRMSLALDGDRFLRVKWHRLSGKVDYIFETEDDGLI